MLAGEVHDLGHLGLGHLESVDAAFPHAVLVDVSKRWRGIKLTPGDLEKLNALRSEVVPLAEAG